MTVVVEEHQLLESVPIIEFCSVRASAATSRTISLNGDKGGCRAQLLQGISDVIDAFLPLMIAPALQ